MKFDLRQLQAFVTLSDCGNFREASERLFITQPALTKQIQSLEKFLGVTLFMRGRHGAQLTSQGSQLLDNARALVEQGKQFERTALDLAAGQSGRLYIGFGISSYQSAPAEVAKFRSVAPDVAVYLQDMPSAFQEELLLSGEMQLGYMRKPVKDGLEWRYSRRDELVLAIPQALKSDGFDAEQYLHQQPLKLMKMVDGRCPGLNAQVDNFLLRFQPVEFIQEARDLHTLVALVAAGIGCAIVPASISNIVSKGVVLVTLSGKYSAWDVGIAWNPAIDDPARDRFLAVSGVV